MTGIEPRGSGQGRRGRREALSPSSHTGRQPQGQATLQSQNYPKPEGLADLNLPPQGF